MQRIESWKVWAFVITLSVVGFAANTATDYLRRSLARQVVVPVQESSATAIPPIPNADVVYRRKETDASPTEAETPEQAEQRRARAKAISQKRAAEEAAEQHTNDLARYVNPGVTRRSEKPIIGIAVVSDTRAFDSDIAGALGSRLDSDKVTIASGLFTPEFISDGKFSDAFSGSRAAYSSLELSNAVDMLLLGRETVSYATNAQLQGIITASLRLELLTAPAQWHGQGRGWSYAANGAGFSQADARAQAMERIQKQISNDTNNFQERWYLRP